MMASVGTIEVRLALHLPQRWMTKNSKQNNHPTREFQYHSDSAERKGEKNYQLSNQWLNVSIISSIYLSHKALPCLIINV